MWFIFWLISHHRILQINIRFDSAQFSTLYYVITHIYISKDPINSNGLADGSQTHNAHLLFFFNITDLHHVSFIHWMKSIFSRCTFFCFNTPLRLSLLVCIHALLIPSPKSNARRKRCTENYVRKKVCSQKIGSVVEFSVYVHWNFRSTCRPG